MQSAVIAAYRERHGFSFTVLTKTSVMKDDKDRDLRQPSQNQDKQQGQQQNISIEKDRIENEDERKENEEEQTGGYSVVESGLGIDE